MIKLTAVAAVGANFELGKGNDLLWHLPEDFKFFKKVTMGAPIVMGRKTFESIGKPLPGRKNIVLTRDDSWKHEGVEVYPSIDSFIDAMDKSVEHFIIGGAEIYKQFLPVLSTLYLTHVNASFSDADAFFPEIKKENWSVETLLTKAKDEKHDFSFEVKKYSRTN